MEEVKSAAVNINPTVWLHFLTRRTEKKLATASNP
jgi:hypothetical protein